MVKHIVYCDTCEKFVELKRKSFDHMYHELLCIMFLTVILAPLYLIFKYFQLENKRIHFKRKNCCPHCETKFDLKNLPKPPENVTMPVKTDGLK